MLAPAMTRTSSAAEQRVAIVTGASSGIGEASARALSSAGYRVVLTARRADLLEGIGKDIHAAGGSALAVPADLASEDDTRRVYDQTLATYGRVDLLLNNAGYSPAYAIEQLPRDELRRTFEVNFFGGQHLASLCIATMREQGGGRIINMSSMASKVAAPLAITYAATKGAMEAASDGMRLELAPWNIHVSLVIPGFVDTATFDNSRNAAQHLRDDPDNPYRKMMFDMDDFAMSQLEKPLSPDDVAQVVVEAATARRPRARYFAPKSARLQSALLGSLPEWLLDRILLRLYKIADGRK